MYEDGILVKPVALALWTKPEDLDDDDHLNFGLLGRTTNSLQFCNLPNLKSNVVNTNVV